MRVFVYRNRHDDHRQRDELVFCHSCGGWYGVPHTENHCRKGRADRPGLCACRPCREAAELPVEGTYGFWTTARKWQP